MASKISDDLIINVRDQLHWYQRLTTDVCTAAMWGGWLYLWRPVVSLLAWLHGWGLIMHPANVTAAGRHAAFAGHQAAPHAVAAGTSLISMDGLLTLAAAACMLMLWSLLPARKIKSQSRVTTVRDCAEYFDLPEQQIRDGRDTSVCVVHHDEEGRIVRIEQRG